MSVSDEVCPLTLQNKNRLLVPIFNPIDGKTYEYASIVLWLESNGRSPDNDMPCTKHDLIAKHDLVLVIDVSGSMRAAATSPHLLEKTDLRLIDLVGSSSLCLLKAVKHCKPYGCTFRAVFYNERVRHVFERELLTEHTLRDFEECMRTHAQPGGFTNWSLPLGKVLSDLADLPDTRTDVIFFTDGNPNQQVDRVLTTVHETAKEGTSVSLHAVVFGHNVQECRLLKDVCSIVNSRQSKQQQRHSPSGMYFAASVMDVMDTMLHLAVSMCVSPSERRLELRMVDEHDPERLALITLLRDMNGATQPVVSRFNGSHIKTTQREAALKLAESFVKQYQGCFEDDIIAAVTTDEVLSTWGEPFLLSLLDAHENRERRNRHDKTCFKYSSLHTDWKKIHDDVSKVFKTFSMPVSIDTSGGLTAASSAQSCNFSARTQGHVANSSAPRPVADYYMVPSAGCVDPDTMVMTPVGFLKACDVKPGTVVVVSAEDPSRIAKDKCPYKTAVVDLVMETNHEIGEGFEVCDVDGIGITGWHPLKLTFAGPWRYPTHLTSKTRKAKALYSFVLGRPSAGPDRRASNVIAKGVGGLLVVAALGHELTEEGAAHEYWGTSRVVEDLLKCGPVDGIVRLSPADFVRRSHDESVCAIRKHQKK